MNGKKMKIRTEDLESIRDIEEYDINQTKKLLQNIKILSDLRNYPVQNPKSVTMEKTTLKEFVKWYFTEMEEQGGDELSYKMIEIIHYIDQHLINVTSKVEEGFRKLLTVADRRKKRLSFQEKKISEIQYENEVMKQQIQSLILITYNYESLYNTTELFQNYKKQYEPQTEQPVTEENKEDGEEKNEKKKPKSYKDMLKSDEKEMNTKLEDAGKDD
jgi:hypothetical protein